MENKNHKTSSVSSELTREQLLKESLKECPEMLLEVAKLFGQESKEYLIAERLADLVKREYEFLLAKREYEQLCKKNNMMLKIMAIKEISDMAKTKKALNEALDKMGLN
jgi:hypothetical protein